MGGQQRMNFVHSVLPLPLFAVHIADSVLAWPWVAAGWFGAALLALLGSWRIRDDEVPRIALLAAASFVASSIHVRLGPGSAHLILNGLLGVVLGWRAPLAILTAVAMQAVLLGHGGYSTIGVNGCIMALPALAAGPLFGGLRRLPGARRAWFRAGVVGVTTIVFVLGLVNAVSLLYTKFQMGEPDKELVIELAKKITCHPLTLLAEVVLAAGAFAIDRRLDHAPEFPLGLLVGELSVLTTVILHCVVLIFGGESDWQIWALIDLIVHLPIAVIEGVVLGFTVGFLARVKPEMLGWKPRPPLPEMEEGPLGTAGKSGTRSEAITTKEEGVRKRGKWPLLLLLLALFFAFPSHAHAHQLKAAAVVRPNWQVQIESWFEPDEYASGAHVQVFRADGELLTKGRLDKKGIFVFSYQHIEPLKVVVSAGGGHRAETAIAAETLERNAICTCVACLTSPPSPSPFLAAPLLGPVPIEGPSPPPKSQVERNTGTQAKNLLIGVSILMGIAALAIQWRRMRQSKQGTGLTP